MILPSEFKMSELFDKVGDINNSEDAKLINSYSGKEVVDCNCKLSYLICYNSNHYVSFVRNNQSWYYCEDSDTDYIGDSNDLFRYLKLRKLIPYIVFYQTCEDEDNGTQRYDKSIHDSQRREEGIRLNLSVDSIKNNEDRLRRKLIFSNKNSCNNNRNSSPNYRTSKIYH